MRVFIINSVCGTGSTGKIVTDICNFLTQNGHEVKIGYGLGSATGVEKAKTVKVSNKIDYFTHNLLSRITDRAGFYSILGTKKLIREIQAFSPDVIHLHNLHGYYLNIRLLFEFLKKADIPVVWTLHDCWAFTGHCAHFSYVHCMKWMDGCHHCPQKRAYPKSYIMDQSKKNYKEKKELFSALNNMIIVTPSYWLKSMVQQSYLNKYEIDVIYNGIDTNKFRNIKNQFKKKYQLENKKVILAVANVWTKKKGFQDVIKISQKLDLSEYQIVMVGVTKEQAKQLPHSILPIMRTNSLDELIEIYSSADVFINTSYEETMGMVTAEALACGIPCFVYDKTAVPEVIDGQSGKVFHAGDIEAICNAIINGEYKCLDGMRKRALCFEKNAQIKKYFSVYEKLTEISKCGLPSNIG